MKITATLTPLTLTLILIVWQDTKIYRNTDRPPRQHNTALFLKIDRLDIQYHAVSVFSWACAIVWCLFERILEHNVFKSMQSLTTHCYLVRKNESFKKVSIVYFIVCLYLLTIVKALSTKRYKIIKFMFLLINNTLQTSISCKNLPDLTSNGFIINVD